MKYQNPTLEILLVSENDIIRTSPNGSGLTNNGSGSIGSGSSSSFDDLNG